MGHTTRRCPSRDGASGLAASAHTCVPFRRALTSKRIRTFVLLAAAILLLATAAIRDLRADNHYPNCIITAIDANSGLVTSQETSSGKTFHFQVTDRAQLEHVRIHQGIWFKNGEVSLDGVKRCAFKVVSPPPDAPNKSQSNVPQDAKPTILTSTASQQPGASAPPTSRSNNAGPAPSDARTPEPVGTPANSNPRDHFVTASQNVPESCKVARDDALAILKVLDSKIPAEAQTKAEQAVAKHDRATTLARAWDDFAVAENLYGQFTYASWAGLKAVDLDWQPKYVTNAGIFLFYSGRNKEALLLLSCAYDMGYRSPSLLEALAAVHRRTGDTAKAKQEIQQAQEMAPDDDVINLEVSLLNTGHPPAQRHLTDALDRCIGSVEKHVQSTVSAMKGVTDQLDRIAPDFRASQFTNIHVAMFQKQIAFLKQQSQSLRSAASAQNSQQLQNRYNAALLSCIGVYVLTTKTLLDFPSMLSVHGLKLLFWADVLRIDPKRFADEQHVEPDPSGISAYPGDPQLTIAAFRDYRNALSEARLEENRQLGACTKIKDPKGACQIRVKAAFCATWRNLYSVWLTQTTSRFDLAAHNYDHVATLALDAAASAILDARSFAARTFKDMRFAKSAAAISAPGGASAGPAQQMLRALNFQYHTLLTQQFSKSSSMGAASYLNSEAGWFVNARNTSQESLASEAAEIERICQPIEKRLLEQLAQEEWEEALKMLAENMTSEDIEAKWNDKVNCKGSLGPFSFKIDDKFERSYEGASKWEKEPFSVSGKGNATFDNDGQFVEGSSGLKGAADGNYGPFAGKGDISILGVYNSKNGLSGVIDLQASLGVGLHAGEAKFYCYPGAGQIEINPRALVDDAVSYISKMNAGPSSED